MSNWATTNQFITILNRVRDLFAIIPPAKIRQCLYAIMLVWLLSLSADIFWLLIPAPVSKVGSKVSDINGEGQMPSNVNQLQINVAAMQEWNLFGGGAEIDDTETEDTLDTENASVTTLQLKLVGIMFASVAEDGFAVIDNQGNSGLYKVGDTIPVGGKVILAKVLVDRVIIDNNGKAESILLYADSANQPMNQAESSRNVGAPKVLDQRNNPQLSAMAGNYRDQLLTNPMSFADIIKVSVAKDADGSLLGYRIRPGRDRQQFSDFGLMSGDIVTSINGVALDDPQKAMELYGQLREATEASVVVRRGSQDINLILGLPH